MRPIINVCDNLPHVGDLASLASAIEASSSVAAQKVGGRL
jgi:hypothetical protein